MTQPSDDRESEEWLKQHAEELSRDPVLRAEFDEDVRRVNAGLHPSGTRLTSDELAARARGTN